MVNRRRHLVTLILLGLVTTATMIAAAGPAQTDPRNTSDEYYDSIDGARCMSCHQEEGYDPLIVSFSRALRVVALDTTETLDVQVVNPWKHALYDVVLTVDLDAAPDVRIPVDRGTTPPPHKLTEEVEVPRGRDNAVEIPFPVEPNATSLSVVAAAEEALFGSLASSPPNLHLLVMSDRPVESRGDRMAREVRLDAEALRSHPAKEWTALLWHDEEDLDPELTVTVDIVVDYTPPDRRILTFTTSGIRAGEAHTFSMPIELSTTESNLIDLQVTARAFWDHASGTDRNNGIVTRFATLNVRGGDETVTTAAAAFPQPVGPLVNITNLLARIFGIVGALLVPLAMVSGGILGKRSRRALNRMLGGARRRVLLHGAMSWIILAVATGHLALAFIESRFTWTHGLLWGGAAWLLLTSLGVTGLLQTRMIKHWDYRTWRATHLWSAVGVFAFAALHTLIDGSDLGVVRDALPFLERLVWP
ncbi:MAG: ferric reductase-like transmembrane domain-containing protein [Euryarchaeota archaeon]|nr:ferric reductase-like transmembrane domain-containing protein [Euryarchaeota archaeon]